MTQALIFTAEGDMRQALNNAQATQAGFGLISQENVFKARAPPHPPLPRFVRKTYGCSLGCL